MLGARCSPAMGMGEPHLPCQGQRNPYTLWEPWLWHRVKSDRVRHSNELIILWWFASHFGDLVVHCQHSAGNQYSTAHARSCHTAGPSERDAANSVLRNHVPHDRKIIMKLNNHLHLEKLPTFPSTWSRTGNSWTVVCWSEILFFGNSK